MLNNTKTAAVDPPHNNPDQQPGPRLAFVQEQPGLPITFEARRGCDQIRARVYHDPRLTSQEALLAVALSEFVNTTTYTAHPKQARLAAMMKTNPSQVSRLLHRLEGKAVIEIDRCRTYCRYVFQEVWRGAFRPLLGRSRFASHANQDLRLTQITGEPVQKNLISDPIAAAGTSRATSADRRQQQQQHDRDEVRIEGLFGAIAARCRELGYDYDERDERRRLREGEIDIDRLQRHAGDLAVEMRERRLRRAHGPQYGPTSRPAG